MGLRPREFYKWPKLMEDGSIRPATHLDAWNGEIKEILPRASYFGPAKKFREILFIKKFYKYLISDFLGETYEGKIYYVNALYWLSAGCISTTKSIHTLMPSI